MKILVTGGAGFIASHVTDSFLAAGHQVLVVDNFSSGKRSNLPENNPQLTIKEADIRDLDQIKAIFKEFQPDVIDHHAAQISVVVSAEDPFLDLDLNVKGMLNILEAIRHEAPQAKMIYASSGGAMYGPDGVLPHTETSLAEPLSPYGLTKHTAERYVWLYRSLYGLKATVLRYANVYGPRQDAHGEAGVCAIFSERMTQNKPVTIYGDGSPTRDYVFVGDIAAANVAVLEKGEGEAFNISTGLETSTKDVFEDLKSATNYALEPNYAPLRPGELEQCYLSPEKAKVGLGWEAKISFTEGIIKTVEWYRS